MKKAIFCICLCAVICLSFGAVTYKKLSDSNEQISQLNNKIDNLVQVMNNSYDDSEEVHDLYDDTAVVEAYKKGDSSKLTDDKDKYIFEQASRAIEENIKDDMSDYDKEKAIYDYMYKMTSFDENALAAISATGQYSHTPYGFFKEHSTICVGNATTFKLFMDMLGIDCKIIHSTSNGEHAWDIVRLDGDWYHVDLTFDNLGGKEPAYSFFNVTDDAKDNGDYPWDKSEFPQCTSTKYSYAYNNSVEVKTVYDIPEQLKKAIDKKQASVFFKVALPTGSSPQDFKEQVYMVMSYASSEKYMVTTSMTMLVDDNKYLILNMTVMYADDYNVSGKTQKPGEQSLVDHDKMSDKFAEAFGSDLNIMESDEAN